MNQVLSWATKQGVECDMLRGSNHRGLYAAKNIPSGVAFVKIPQQLLLHAGLCYVDCPFGQAFNELKAEADVAMDDRHLLCLLLIVERAKGTSSKWHPYISYLPQTYDDPLWWKGDEVKLLAGTRLDIAVQEHVKLLGRLNGWRNRLFELQRTAPDTASSELLEQADDGWPLSDKAVLWAKSTVWSRAFNIPYLGGVNKPGVALLPVGDLLDHDPERHVSWHTGPTGTDPFSFISHSPIGKGHALYSNYGNKSNEELILGYGFALPHNSADFFHVMIGLGRQPSAEPESSSALPDERVIQRQALLRRLGLSTSHYLKLQASAGAGQQPIVLGPQVPIQQLLNTACICLMPDHLAYQWWPAPSAVDHSSDPQQSQQLPGGAAAAEGHLAIPGQVQVKGISASTQHPCTDISSPQTATAHSTILALQGKADGGGDLRMGFRPLQGASEGASEGAHRASEMAQRAPEGAVLEGSSMAPGGAQGASEVHTVRLEMQDSAPAGPKGSDGGPFGCSPVRVQLQVLHSLRRLLTSKLDAIAGGNAEEDWSLAQQPGCSYAACMALGYRAAQKQIAAAALDAVASTAAEVVQVAVAVLSCGSSWASNLDERWQKSWGVLYHKVQEAVFLNTPNASHTIDDTQQQPQAAAAPCDQSCNPWDGCQWGLTTTDAVQPGEVLLTIPRQSVVITHKPDQTLLQMACLAFHQAPTWYSHAASPQLGFQAAADEQGRGHGQGQEQEQRQELGTVGGGVQGGQAQTGKGPEALGELVGAWTQPGRVGLTLPGRLLMAHLWPEHVSSGFGHQCSHALSGLPVELEVMAEVDVALQKLQYLLPQLQELMGLQGQSFQAGAGLFQAHVSLLWAMTCMERCGRSNPSGQGLLLVPAVSALPQEFLGVIADLDWDASTEALTLTAACSLPASTPLTPAMTAVGADPDHLVMTHGLAALSWRRARQAGQRQQAVQLSLQGQGNLQMPWQMPDAASFQLCIEPPEEDQCRETKLQLLAASALGTAHALTATSSQERLLAALGLCSCDSAGLSQLGAPALLQAFHANTDAAREQTESAASSIQQNLVDNAEQGLREQQTQLVAKLLADRALQEVAQMTLVSLLEAELSQLSCRGKPSESAWPEQNSTDASRGILAEYRQEVAHILEVQLMSAKSMKSRPHKKRKSSSNKRKHKKTSQSNGA